MERLQKVRRDGDAQAVQQLATVLQEGGGLGERVLEGKVVWSRELGWDDLAIHDTGQPLRVGDGVVTVQDEILVPETKVLRGQRLTI